VFTDASEQTNEELILSFLADGGEEFTSGEVLSGKLGLSRTAVWKYVESLRTKGYRIDAVPARGYRLVEIPDRLTPLEISPLLNTHDIGRTIHYFDEVSSTNEVAFRLASEGASHGEVVVAERQSQGRGRRGRSWFSPPGLNLYCSLILRPDLSPQRAPELTLVAAAALAETVERGGAEAKIKWPNDIMVNGKKVAGILTELSADPETVHFAVVGMGINLNGEYADFPAELKASATSLRAARGQLVPRALFAAALWTQLEQRLDQHAAEGFGPIRSACRALSDTLGREVLVKSEHAELRGLAEDIDDGGALLVRTSQGLERVISGDVEQLRPRKTTSE
jgi:BirA family biotin operon repressor/biotin-[acetyl-CoA-carboxylase] ligase